MMIDNEIEHLLQAKIFEKQCVLVLYFLKLIEVDVGHPVWIDCNNLVCISSLPVFKSQRKYILAYIKYYSYRLFEGVYVFTYPSSRVEYENKVNFFHEGPIYGSNKTKLRTELFEIELFTCIKVDLALNNLQWLICHKTKPN